MMLNSSDLMAFVLLSFTKCVRSSGNEQHQASGNSSSNDAKDFNNRINETSNYLAAKLVSSGIIFNLDRDEFSKQFTESCKELTNDLNIKESILIEWFNKIKQNPQNNTNEEEATPSSQKSTKLDNSHSIDLKDYLSICIKFLDRFKNEKIKIALADCFMESNFLSSQLKGKLVAFLLYNSSYDNILFLQEILSDEVMKKYYFDFNPVNLSTEESVEWLQKSFSFFINYINLSSVSSLTNALKQISMILLLIIDQYEEKDLIETTLTFLSKFESLLKEPESSRPGSINNEFVKKFTYMFLDIIRRLRKDTFIKIERKSKSFIRYNSLDYIDQALHLSRANWLLKLNEIKLALGVINDENKSPRNKNYESFLIFSNKTYFKPFCYTEFRKIIDALLNKIKIINFKLKNHSTQKIFKKKPSSSNSTQQAISNDQDLLPSTIGISFEKLVSCFSIESFDFYMNHFLNFLDEKKKTGRQTFLACVESLLHSFSLSADTRSKFESLRKYLSNAE